MEPTIYSNDNFRRAALITLDHFTRAGLTRKQQFDGVGFRKSERLLRGAMDDILSAPQGDNMQLTMFDDHKTVETLKPKWTLTVWHFKGEALAKVYRRQHLHFEVPTPKEVGKEMLIAAASWCNPKPKLSKWQVDRLGISYMTAPGSSGRFKVEITKYNERYA